MASRMSLRPKATTQVVPDSLLKTTRIEQRARKEEAEAEKLSAAEELAQKKSASVKCIASQMDKQSKQDKIDTMHPNRLSAGKNLPLQSLQSTTKKKTNVHNNEGHSSSSLDVDIGLLSDSSDSDVQETQRLEEALAEKARKKAERKAAKTSLRDSIMAERKEQATPLITPLSFKLKLPAKRPQDGSDPERNNPEPSSKRSKLNDVGGLRDNWKASLYSSHKHTSSTASLASSTDLGITDVELEEVEFGVEEDMNALEVQRNAKSHEGKGKMASKDLVSVGLEVVDVDAIATEERETGKPALPPRRRTFTKHDLPIKLTSDHLIWNNCLQPELIEWCGTREGQFSLSSDLNFREIIKMLWDKHLGSLPHIHDTYKIGSTVYQCRDHPAILSFAQQQVRNYRSKMGQTGLNVVEAKMRTFTMVEERKDYAERMILHDAFIFEFPGATRSESQGTFRGELVLRTFAFHLTWALSSRTSHGNPAGALALAVVSVHRALTAWLPGHDSIKAVKETSRAERNAVKAMQQTEKQTFKLRNKAKGIAKNTPDSFGEELASAVRFWYHHTTNLKEQKWDQIYLASETFLVDIARAGAGPALKDALKTNKGPRVEGSQSLASADDDDALVLSD
ncbi:hypothetical protein GGU11DRAFT_811657 [Lentinula aff. detonsa]|nr:hypothetical protein GGU11DRAFT_811657 [Lentinula aff. detonsa]